MVNLLDGYPVWLLWIISQCRPLIDKLSFTSSIGTDGHRRVIAFNGYILDIYRKMFMLIVKAVAPLVEVSSHFQPIMDSRPDPEDDSIRFKNYFFGLTIVRLSKRSGFSSLYLRSTSRTLPDRMVFFVSPFYQSAHYLTGWEPTEKTTPGLTPLSLSLTKKKKKKNYASYPRSLVWSSLSIFL